MRGLKAQLNNLLEKEGYLSLQQVYDFAESLGHKQKTAERVLNPSLSPNVITIKNEKGFITGYRWSENMGVLTAVDERKSPSSTIGISGIKSFPSGGKSDVCCSSQKYFSVCSKECLAYKAKNAPTSQGQLNLSI